MMRIRDRSTGIEEDPVVNRGIRLNLKWLLPVTVLVLGVALLAACGGDDDTTTPTDVATTAPAGESPTATSGASPTLAVTPPDIGSFCDLVTPEEADVALGEFVTGFPCGTLNGQWQADSGIYLRLEPGSAEDLEAGAEMEGVSGEPVTGIGDEAAWFFGVQGPSHHFDSDETVSLGVLTLRQGEVYLRVMLNLPAVDSAAQREIAKGVAATAITRLP
jgi:hypothetical protein